MEGMLGYCKSDDSIPITHLDYSYIGQCKDTKVLEKIVKILRSGDEGIFPELIKFAEDKLVELSPKSKLLYKDLPAKTLQDLGMKEKNDILIDLQQWTNDVNTVDKSLGNTRNGIILDNLPPIRANGFEYNEETKLKTEQKEKVKTSISTKRVAPRSYDEWDKIDVEKELNKTEADQVSSKVDNMKIGKKKIPIQTQVDITTKGISLPREELQIQANQEKEKGNESFKAGDFDEALIYYNRSLSIIQITAVFNNRAITLIKLKKYNEAITDCNIVLQEEIDNIKAFLRRGLAYKLLGKTQTAINDFEHVLEMEPQNKRAKELLKETEKLLGNRCHKEEKAGRPFLIEEVESNEENKNLDHMNKECFQKGTKLKVEELDHTDSSNVTMNGHVTEKIEDTINLEQTKEPRKGKRLKIVEIDHSEDHETYNEKDQLLRNVPMETDVDHGTTDVSGVKGYKLEENENDSWLNITEEDQDVSFSPLSDEEKPLDYNKMTFTEHHTENIETHKEQDQRQELDQTNNESEDCNSGCRQDMSTRFQSKANKNIGQKSTMKITGSEMEIDTPRSEMKTDSLGSEIISDNGSEVNVNTIGSEMNIDSPGSEMIADNTASEVKVDTTGSEIKTDSLGSEMITDNTGSEVETDTTRSEMESDSLGSEMITDNSGSEIEVDTTKSEMNTDSPPSELLIDNTVSEVKGDTIGSEIKTDSLGSEMITDYTESEVKVDIARSGMKTDSSESEMITDNTESEVKVDTHRSEVKNDSSRLDNISSEVKIDTILSEIKIDSLESEMITDNTGSEVKVDITRLEMKIDSSESEIITDNTDSEIKVDAPRSKMNWGSSGSEIITDNTGSEVKVDTIGSKMTTESVKLVDNKTADTNVIKTDSPQSINKNTDLTNSRERSADNQTKVTESLFQDDVTKVLQGNVQDNYKTETIVQVPPPPLPVDVLRLKDEGNTYYKAGNYGEAIEKYSQCMDLLSSEKEIYADSFAVLLSNRAMCKSKIGNCRGCINDCNESLELVVSPKALLRRAGAYDTLEKYGHAYVDYQAALRIDNSIKTAWDASTRLSLALRDQHGFSWRDQLPKSTLKIERSRFSPNVACNSSNAIVSTSTNIQQIKRTDVQATKPTQDEDTKQTVIQDSEPKNIQQDSKPENTKEFEPANVQAEDKMIYSESYHEGQKSTNVEVDSKKSETTEERFRKLKDSGNKFVQQQKFQEAIRNYSECIEIMPTEVVIYTNRALCYLKLNEPNKAEEDCSRALERSPNNVKALFRRGQARKMNKRHRDALQDLTSLLKLEPGNTAAKKELESTKELWREELRIIQAKGMKSSNNESNAKEDAGKKGKKRVKIKEVDSVTQTTCPRKEAEQKSPQKSCNNSPSEPPRPPQKPQIRKATGFEFLQAWNNVKGKGTKEHAEVLTQIEPTQLPKVLSNKIDGNMIQEIVSAVCDHFLTKDKISFGYNVLKYLSRAERFNMAVMFVSTKDKSRIKKTIDEIESRVKEVNLSQKDISELKKAYKVT